MSETVGQYQHNETRGAEATMATLLQPQRIPASHTRFSWEQVCKVYQRPLVNLLSRLRAPEALDTFVAIASFLDPASLLRLSRVSIDCLITMERAVWWRLLGEPPSRLKQLAQQFTRQAQSRPEQSPVHNRNSLASAAAVPPPSCWRHLFMRRVCKPWVPRTQQLVAGVSRVYSDGSYRDKFDCHLFEVSVIGYGAEDLVRAHCQWSPRHGGKSLPTGPVSAAQERSNAYFTEHFYDDVRPPYQATHIRYQGLVAQLQVSSQTISTGYGAEFACAAALVFVFKQNDKEAWTQIASVDIPIVQSTVEPSVPRFIVCIVDQACNTCPKLATAQTTPLPRNPPTRRNRLARDLASPTASPLYHALQSEARTRNCLKVGDAAAFARQHGFFFIEVPAQSSSLDRGAIEVTPGPAVDAVFFAVGATLLDKAKHELAMVDPELDMREPALAHRFAEEPSSEGHDAEHRTPQAAFENFETGWIHVNPNISAPHTVESLADSVESTGKSGSPTEDAGKHRHEEADVLSDSDDSVGEVPRKHHKFGSGNRRKANRRRRKSATSDVGCDVSCGCVIC